MNKQLTTLSSILFLFTTITCSKPHLTNVSSKSIQAGTVTIKPTSGIKGPTELIIDGNRIYVECKKNKNRYSRLEISGLGIGKHQFILISAHEVFGPDQFELELGDKHGEYKSIFSKQLSCKLPSEASDNAPTTVSNDHTIRAVLK